MKGLGQEPRTRKRVAAWKGGCAWEDLVGEYEVLVVGRGQRKAKGENRKAKSGKQVVKALGP